MRKFRILCAAALICLIPGAAMAAEGTANASLGTVGVAEMGTIEEVETTTEAKEVSGYAVVEKVDRGIIQVKMDSGAAVSNVQLSITHSSLILNNINSAAVDINSIKAGDRVYVNFTTNPDSSSLIQANLNYMFTNVASAIHGFVWTVEGVSTGSNGSTQLVTVNGGKLVLSVDYVENIKPGSRIAAWYDTVTNGKPAVATVRRMAVVDASKAVAGSTADTSYLWIHNVPVQVVMDEVDGVVCVPLRTVATKLGYDLVWDGNRMAATISQNGKYATVMMNRSNVVINGDKAMEMGADAYLYKGGVMYVPVNLFKLLGFDVQIGELVSISAAQ